MTEQNQKVVLVTGGAGFIGSFLCEELLKQGAKVICVDDFSTGHVRNIEQYLRNPNFQFLRLDINKPFNLETFSELESFQIPFFGIQEIYHLAVPRSIKEFGKYRVQTVITQSLGTANILEIAVKYKSKVMLVSSAAVYGNRTPEVSVFDERYSGVVNHMEPRACYGEGKRFAETMFMTYGDVYGIDARIARVFRTYGPRMPLFDGHQIPDFILQALNGERLTIQTSEQHKTSLIYVADVVSGLTRLMSLRKNPGPVNLGSDTDLSLVDVARKVIEITGSASDIEFIGSGEQVLEVGLPDLRKAEEELGWMPLVRLEDGLQKTVDYIKANKILLTSDIA